MIALPDEELFEYTDFGIRCKKCDKRMLDDKTQKQQKQEQDTVDFIKIHTKSCYMERR